jgi:hypothetical protein
VARVISKRPIRRLKSSACSTSERAAAVVSSAIAAFCWVPVRLVDLAVNLPQVLCLLVRPGGDIRHDAVDLDALRNDPLQSLTGLRHQVHA